MQIKIVIPALFRRIRPHDFSTFQQQIPALRMRNTPKGHCRQEQKRRAVLPTEARKKQYKTDRPTRKNTITENHRSPAKEVWKQDGPPSSQKTQSTPPQAGSPSKHKTDSPKRNTHQTQRTSSSQQRETKPRKRKAAIPFPK